MKKVHKSKISFSHGQSHRRWHENLKIPTTCTWADDNINISPSKGCHITCISVLWMPTNVQDETMLEAGNPSSIPLPVHQNLPSSLKTVSLALMILQYIVCLAACWKGFKAMWRFGCDDVCKRIVVGVAQGGAICKDNPQMILVCSRSDDCMSGTWSDGQPLLYFINASFTHRLTSYCTICKSCKGDRMRKFKHSIF